MNWSQQLDTNGQPQWVGVDAIFNVNRHHKMGGYRFLMALVLASMALLGLVGVAALSALPAAFQFAPNFILGLFRFVMALTGASICLGLGYLIAAKVLPKIAAPAKFICRKWEIIVDGSMLDYSALAFDPPYLTADDISPRGDRWRVHVDEIATVESGPTDEWQRGREYGGGPSFELEKFKAVPEAEYQTYLFLNDGSRLVVHTSNADREGTQTLATSIRSWVSEARSLSRSASAGAPTVPSTIDGFSL